MTLIACRSKTVQPSVSPIMNEVLMHKTQLTGVTHLDAAFYRSMLVRQACWPFCCATHHTRNCLAIQCQVQRWLASGDVSAVFCFSVAFSFLKWLASPCHPLTYFVYRSALLSLCPVLTCPWPCPCPGNLQHACKLSAGLLLLVQSKQQRHMPPCLTLSARQDMHMPQQ